MKVLAHLNGSFADAAQPAVRADDLGIVRGDGVFETIPVVDGVARDLAEHLDRLDYSAALLDLEPPNIIAWRDLAASVVTAWQGEPDFALKLVYTRGSESHGNGSRSEYALAYDFPTSVRTQRLTGVSVATLNRGVVSDASESSPWLILCAKSLSYGVNMAALREAERRGRDDVIFVSADGYVMEAPTCSVVLLQADTLTTPSPTIGTLRSTSQAALYRGAEQAGWKTRVERIHYSELYDAEGVFLVSSARRVTPVNAIDSVSIPGSMKNRDEIRGLYESQYTTHHQPSRSKAPAGSRSW